MRPLRERLLAIRERMVRDPLPPESVAAGWALGVFVGCAFPFGFQLIVSVPLAMMMRVSKIGATVGTLISNPVTILFIYPAQTYIVNRLLFGGSLSFSKLMCEEWTWATVRHLGGEVMTSFFLGGFVLALVLTPIAYFAVRQVVIVYRGRMRGRQHGRES